MSALYHARTAPLLAWISDEEWDAVIDPESADTKVVETAREKLMWLRAARRQTPRPERGQVWADMNGKINEIHRGPQRSDMVAVQDIVTDGQGVEYVTGHRLGTGRPTKIRLDRFFCGVNELPRFILVSLAPKTVAAGPSPLDAPPTYPGQLIEI